jgi:hypothetical protein
MFQFKNLDNQAREFMLQELELDIKNGTLYISPRLSESGRKDYENLLKEVFKNGNEVSLAKDLRSYGRMKITEQRHRPKGGFTTAKVPETAPDTLAEGEFNRFYARGLCCLAIEKGIHKVEVYRAKPVTNPRPESQAMIGKRIDAKALLKDLRTHPGVEPALGLPAGPNSGLSIRIPSSD